jgi:hypothetical protein
MAAPGRSDGVATGAGGGRADADGAAAGDELPLPPVEGDATGGMRLAAWPGSEEAGGAGGATRTVPVCAVVWTNVVVGAGGGSGLVATGGGSGAVAAVAAGFAGAAGCAAGWAED